MKKIVKVGLSGGLGNQLFQFALGISTSIANDCYLYFFWNQRKSIHNTPRKFALKFLGINLGKLYKIEICSYALSIKKIKYKFVHVRKSYKYYEQHFHFTEIPKTVVEHSSIKYIGYWQSSKYFTEYSSILKQYILKNLPSSMTFTENKAALHIRLGDFVSSKYASENHGIISKEYLELSLNLLAQDQIKKIDIYTDSVHIATELLGSLNSTFDFNFVSTNNTIIDLGNMVNYSHFIGSNSSFSWWAAFLGSDNRKIIMPKKWFSGELALRNNTKDLYENKWLVIN